MAAEFTERRIQSNGNTVNVNIDRTQPFVDVQKNGQTQRIYGTQEQLDRFQGKKPDGTPTLDFPPKTGIPKGVAVTYGQDAEGRVTVEPLVPGSGKTLDEILEGAADLDAFGGAGEDIPPSSSTKNVNPGKQGTVIPNPLEQFASVTPLWTLAVLTPKQFNKPSLYRTKDLSFAAQTEIATTTVDPVADFDDGSRSVTLKSSIIFSSGGRGDATRATTVNGSPEYFIDNFKMMSVIAPSPATGNSNAINFEFDILEPYSMGLLLQSMQSACLKAGYNDYLEAPFLLRLDFKGYNDKGQFIKSIKPKHFVMKFKKVEFSVNEGGSQYSVQGYPYNHQGFADTVDTMFQDISIGPQPDADPTVFSVLADPNNEKSLVRVLNDNETKMINQGKYKVRDQYEIQFPERTYDFVPIDKTTEQTTMTVALDTPPNRRSVGKQSSQGGSNTTDAGVNPIGKSTFDYSPKKGGNFAFRKEDDVVNEETGRIERGKLTIIPEERIFNFTQKMKITDIITQTILSCRHSHKAVTGELPITEEGYVNWFRIDVQVEFLEYDDSVGDFAKKYTFRVVPYLAHASVFGNTTSKPPGQEELKKQIVKEYNYIYTGQNADVIDFDIKINNLFYTGINPSTEGNTESESNQDNAATAEETASSTPSNTGPDPKAQVSNLGKSKQKRDPGMFSVFKGGSGAKSVEQKVAENFHDALVKNASADLIQVELKIIGDTFWLVESGLSNHFVQAAPAAQFMNDGTVNYEGNDVFIRINFRTPADVDPKGGLYKFSAMSKRSPFSGIYRVYKCENEFSGGLFTQTLSCVRMQGQVEDYDGENITEDKTTALATQVAEKKPPKTNPAQELPLADKLAQALGFGNLAELQAKFPAGPADKPKEPEGPTLTERRRQSNGVLVNFNIDRTKPFVDETDADGNILRIFES